MPDFAAFSRPAAAGGEQLQPAVARGAPQGSYVHPLQQQLEALRYPAWLLEPPVPAPPQVRQDCAPRYMYAAGGILLYMKALHAVPQRLTLNVHEPQHLGLCAHARRRCLSGNLLPFP